MNDSNRGGGMKSRDFLNSLREFEETKAIKE